MRNLLLTTLATLILISCQKVKNKEQPITDLVQHYIVLELSMQQYDKNHVDAYFGPENLQQQAKDHNYSLTQIAQKSQHLFKQLAQHSSASSIRNQALRGRLTALQTRIKLLQNYSLDFDSEALSLFGQKPPVKKLAVFEQTIATINALLPGSGDVAQKVRNFQQQFVIPKDKIAVVFNAAIAECRKRTLKYIQLPKNENFQLEFVTDKPWSGYNWYKGQAQSLIQINTDLPIYIERAVDLGCHEGYPGHHTYSTLLEQNLVQQKNWLEFSIYPLYSPQSFIAEGSANYGIDLAFPQKQRLIFEKNVLYPLAGIDTDNAEIYHKFLQLMRKLSYAGNEVARLYLNQKITAQQAQQMLEQYCLNSKKRAQQRVKFFDAYRSYIINYNLGRDVVQHYIETAGQTPKKRWKKFQLLLASPRTAKDIL